MCAFFQYNLMFTDFHCLTYTGQVDPNLDPVIGTKESLYNERSFSSPKICKNTKPVSINMAAKHIKQLFLYEWAPTKLCFFVLSILHLRPFRSHFYCKNTERNSILNYNLCESIKQNSLVSSKQLPLVYTFMEQVFTPEIKISSLLSVWNSILLVQQSGPSGPFEDFIVTTKKLIV